jgi:8-oxo-dGTP diphosphatase
MILTPDLQKKLDLALMKVESDGVNRLCTGIIVYKNQKVLLVRRVPNDFLGGHYELAGGGVDEGEDILTCLYRECEEELGVKITKIKDILDGFDFFAKNGARVRQINFVVDIEDIPITLSPLEHDDLMWVSKEEYEQKKISKEMKSSLEIFFKSL